MWVNVKYVLGDTLSFVGDQTSYMSICVGEEHDHSLSQLSAQELIHKVYNKIQMVELKTFILNVYRLKKLKVYIYLCILGARAAGVCKQPTDFEQ